MPVLVFRHVPFEHLGLIASVLDNAGLTYRYVDLFEDPDTRISLEECDGIISLGGPMSANDDHPAIHQEIAVLRNAFRLGIPVLGICLGSQMIAKALGSRVYKNPVKEIGWAPIRWTREAHSDPMFRGSAGTDTVFHWHGETFDLPDGAVWLASSRDCRHQAFRFGSNVYALQFHLEVTPAMIGDWLEQPVNASDVAGLAKLPDPALHERELYDFAHRVFGRWAGALVRQAAYSTA